MQDIEHLGPQNHRPGSQELHARKGMLNILMLRSPDRNRFLRPQRPYDLLGLGLRSREIIQLSRIDAEAPILSYQLVTVGKIRA